MKTPQIFRLILVVLFFTLSLGACSKEDDPTPASGILFWSKKQEVTTTKIDCYVDGKLVGTLNKVSTTRPECNDSGSPHADIEPGSHEGEARLPNGQVVKTTFEVSAGQCFFFELI